MKIRKPLGNEISKKVKSWEQIKEEALALRDFLYAKKFDGYWEDAYAISHTQVSNQSFNFFVVNKSIEKEFGSWCVVNLKILKKSKPCTFPEGCMSFMFRTTKHVNRFATVTVTYWTPFLNLFLIPHRKTFKAPTKKGEQGTIATFVCQHEFDHSIGVNIYGK